MTNVKVCVLSNFNAGLAPGAVKVPVKPVVVTVKPVMSASDVFTEMTLTLLAPDTVKVAMVVGAIVVGT